MAGIRRAPQPRAAPPVKPRAPLHQRILGKAQAELDLLDSLEYELEESYNLDLIEPDNYERCQRALQARRDKANKQLDKTLSASTTIKVTRVHAKHKKRVHWSAWEKLGIVFVLIIFAKLFGIH